MQKPGICAVAVEVGRGVFGLERTRPIDLGVEQRVEFDGSAECVPRPPAAAGNVTARYPIDKIRTADNYPGGDDELSMEDNNTSA